MKKSVEMVSKDKMMVIKHKDNSVQTVTFNFQSADNSKVFKRKKADIQHPQPV